jgi:hypothetical protein
MAKTCGCFWKSPIIFADGSVFPCAFAIDAYEKGGVLAKQNFVDFIRLGKIKEGKTPFSDVFDGPISEKMRRLSINHSLSSIPKCDECNGGLCVPYNLSNLSEGEIKQIEKNINSKLTGGLLTIEISHSCNLKCIMCIRGNYEVANLGHLSFSLFKYILDDIEEKGYLFDKLQLFFNGEPLLNPEFIDIVKYLISKNSKKRMFKKIILDTHAQFLTKELSIELCKLDGLSITFSLDAYSKGVIRGRIPHLASYETSEFMSCLQMQASHDEQALRSKPAA